MVHEGTWFATVADNNWASQRRMDASYTVAVRRDRFQANEACDITTEKLNHKSFSMWEHPQMGGSGGLGSCFWYADMEISYGSLEYSVH